MDRKGGARNNRGVETQQRKSYFQSMMLGSGCITSGIPAVLCTSDIYRRPNSWGMWESAKTKKWMQNERPGSGVERGREERERRSGCLYELSQDVGIAAVAN